MRPKPIRRIVISHSKQVPTTVSRRAFAEEEADVESLYAMIYQLMEFQSIEATVSLERVRELLRSGEWMSLLIFMQDNPQEAIGYALFYPKWSSASGNKMLWLEDLYVKPGYRGMRIGHSLMANLAVCCREMKWSAVEFVVLRQNAAADEFYESIGAAMQPNWGLWRWTAEDMREFLARL